MNSHCLTLNYLYLYLILFSHDIMLNSNFMNSTIRNTNILFLYYVSGMCHWLFDVLIIIPMNVLRALYTASQAESNQVRADLHLKQTHTQSLCRLHTKHWIGPSKARLNRTKWVDWEVFVFTINSAADF